MRPIGDRIKQARLAAGLSLRQLADLAAPLSATAISRYENGLDMPGTDVLLRLARALGLKVEYFLRQLSVEITCSHFRKHGRVPAKVRTSLLHRIVGELERYLAVEEVFGPNRFMPFEMPNAASLGVQEVGDAEAVAEQLRTDWDLGLDPIGNLCETLEDRGVKVVLVAPIEKFDGFSCWANGNIPVVAAPDAPPRARQRLAIAEELGHLLLRLSGDVDEEKIAYRFASAFLVPRESVEMEIGLRRGRLSEFELLTLKKKWGLSMESWIHRVHDLRILNESAYRRVQKTFRSRNWHLQEPGDMDHDAAPEQSLRMQRLVEQAVAEDLISAGRAADFLGRYLVDVRQQLGAARESGIL
jgi:transcriptional regulator with XRE-family HTH domain